MLPLPTYFQDKLCFLPLSPLCSVGPGISFLGITVPLTGILPACSPPPQWSSPVSIHCPPRCSQGSRAGSSQRSFVSAHTLHLICHTCCSHTLKLRAFAIVPLCPYDGPSFRSILAIWIHPLRSRFSPEDPTEIGKAQNPQPSMP